MKDSASPSLVRLRRVDYFLKKMPRYVSTDTESYVKGNENIAFPKSVWLVARAIQDAKLDACKLDKTQTFEWAEHALHGAASPKSSAVSVAEPSAAPAETEHEQEPQVATISNLPVQVAIYTLLVSALELTRLDRKPGTEARSKLIDVASAVYLAALNQKQSAHIVSQQVESTAVSEQPKTVEEVPVPNPAA